MSTRVTEHVRRDPARHKCVACGVLISPGERYRQAVHVQADWADQGFIIDRAHTRCLYGDTSGMWEITEEQDARQAADKATKESAVEQFNATYPIGSPVQCWTGLHEGEGALSRTRTAARLNSAGHPVVWVEGHVSCIALSHVEPVGSGRA